MSAMKKGSKKQVLVATAVAALFGLSAMPAQADLIWQLTIGGVAILTVPDNTVDDLNPLPHAITVNPVAANLALGGSAYSLTSAGASSNFGTLGPASIATSALIQNTGVGGALDIEATQEGWLLPTGVPRTLTNAPAATLTFLSPADLMTSTGYNDPNNQHFGFVTPFFTPTSTFSPGNGLCTANIGGVSTCNDLQQVSGISEGNPFSLSQQMTFALGNGIARTIQYTDATTKFADVPEPMTLLLLGTGLVGLGFVRRSKS